MESCEPLIGIPDKLRIFPLAPKTSYLLICQSRCFFLSYAGDDREALTGRWQRRRGSRYVPGIQPECCILFVQVWGLS